MTEDKASNNGSAANPGGGQPLPKQALFVIDLLKESGLTDYEPQVVTQLLEFTHSYVTERLSDAQDYANHAGRANVAMEDVKLSVTRKAEELSTTVLSRNTLMEIAKEKNASGLPTLKVYSGPRLPPDRYCLSSLNYRLKDDGITSSLHLHHPKSEPASGFVDPAQVMPSAGGKKEFVNPQMIMPSGGIKRKWRDDDDYD